MMEPESVLAGPQTDNQKDLVQQFLDGAPDELKDRFTQFVDHLLTEKQADDEADEHDHQRYLELAPDFERNVKEFASKNIRLVEMLPSNDEQLCFIDEMAVATAFDETIYNKEYLGEVHRVLLRMSWRQDIVRLERNSTSYASYDIPRHIGPRYNVRMADALEHNSRVKELSIDVRRSEDDPDNTQYLDNLPHFEKIFNFIRDSETLEELVVIAGELSCEVFLANVFLAVSKRSKELPHLHFYDISVARLKVLCYFFRLNPKVGKLTLEDWYEAGLDDIPPNVADTFRNAGALAEIRNLEISTDCPFFVLESLEYSAHLEQVIFKRTDAEAFRDPHTFQRACLLFDACRNTHFKITIELLIDRWSQELWLAFANSLQGNDSVVGLCLSSCTIALDNPGPVMQTLFTGTERKLKLEWVSDIDIRTINAIVAATQTLSVLTIWDDESCEALFSSLTTSSCVVQSLEFYTEVRERSGNEKHFLKHLPKFFGVKSLQIGLANVFDYEEEQTKEYFTGFKNRFFGALWKNRSLTENVCIAEDEYASDKDRAFMERVVQRNRHLPGLLEPSSEMRINPALLPFLLKMSCETDLNECFGAIRCIPKIS